METGFLSIVKPQSAAANQTQWKIVTLTNRASQTGETKTLAWSSGLRNGDSLGWRLKQLLILQHVISKRWKGSSVRKCQWKHFLTHNATHLLFSVVPPDCKKKKKNLLHSQDRESIQKIQQVRGPQWEWSTQMHAWGNLCGRVSLLKCLWLLFDIQQQETSREPSQRVGAWERGVRN